MYILTRSSSASSISHSLQCDGCNGQFEGTKALKHHIQSLPSCLASWGGSLEELTKIVNKEFNKRRNREIYSKNPETESKRKKAEYDNDPDKHRQRKNEEYATDPNKQRERKKNSYYDNLEKERERKRRDEKARFEAEPEKKRLEKNWRDAMKKECGNSNDDLTKFLEEGKYGPIFSCIFCHQLKWKNNVLEAKEMDMNSPYVDQQYITVDHIKLFKKQDKYYKCKTCNTSVQLSHRPRMSTKNALHCPFDDVPRDLLIVNEVEYNFLVILIQ